ncbi:hypothetical protein LCGC14_2021510 [marine sediment metagenome]|uniref:Uncharacterized protein n=1 Tax=marine sediment metagenome TaxID=412755 RepID=A0A0F9EXI5_9ZZZZ
MNDMIYPYHFVKDCVFFEAGEDGSVSIIRKAESRLQSRTLLRVDLTSEEWLETIAVMKTKHKEVKGDKVIAGVDVKVEPTVFGPRSEQGSSPDTLPDASPPVEPVKTEEDEIQSEPELKRRKRKPSLLLVDNSRTTFRLGC